MKTDSVPITLTVANIPTSVVPGGVLVSALNNLREHDKDFKFTEKNDPNFGLVLESVIGVVASEKDKTYWKLLSKKPGGKEEPINGGIGCYQPTANEEIILRFSKK